MLRHKDFFIILIRLLLGYIFFSAGLCKLTHGHFGQIIGPPLLEAELAKYGLGLFAQVIATLQVICGILLISQRFSTIGAIMLMPMNLSILAVTISLNWHGTPYVNGFFILLNILLLVYDWHKLKVLVNPNLAATVRPSVLDLNSTSKFNLVAIVLAAGALIFSRYSIAVTNTFAIAAFAAFGYSIISIKPVGKLQALIIALVMMNMIFITLAGKLIPFAQKLVLYNTVLILILIIATFVKLQAKKVVATT